jgi:2-methylcitrate dehydratase PrpD
MKFTCVHPAKALAAKSNFSSTENCLNYSSLLASYATNLKFADLPDDVILQAKLLTLHVLSVSLAARDTEQGNNALALARGMGGDAAEATIWGDSKKVSAVQAAFANGTLADVLDWEDCSWTGHPSAGAIPAAFAAAEKSGASGQDYITAIVAGYEVYQRIAMAVQPTHENYMKTGWGLTSWQIFAASVPAAKLLTNSEQQMRQAIGISGVMTPIVNRKIQLDRSDMYHYQHGLTSRDGVVAAEIARSGITGLEDVLDGDHGYWVTISDQCDWDWMAKGLGEEFLIMQTLFKRWPVNMWVQQFLDMTDDIRRTESFAVDDVDSITVTPNFQKTQGASRMIVRPDGFLSTTDAQFSIPFCIAQFLLDPNPGADWFRPESLQDQRAIKLAGKVVGAGDMTSPLEAFALFQAGDYIEASIEISLNDGRTIERHMHYPKGHPKNRMSENELADIFRHTAKSTMSVDRIEQTIEAVLDLDRQSSLDDVAKLLRPD